MSLIKQLWIAVAVVMAIAFGGSLVVSMLSARHYLEQQLEVKNIDNANALALSMSQLPKDPVMVELQISAQFDAGHYRFIRITAPDGKTMVERVYKGDSTGAPSWFVALFPISARPGQALIQDGWNQYGTLSLASQELYAYRSLWGGTLELLLWFVVGGLAAGLGGTLLMRAIIRPLGEVVSQAHAIADRRFLVIEEPRAPELRSVARAMNEMVARLKAMFAEEVSRLEALRQRVNYDALTGLPSREYFISHLLEILRGEQFGSSGSVVMVRLRDLNDLNRQLGRQQADLLLKDVGVQLATGGNAHPGHRAGRLKGAEFAVVFPDASSVQTVAVEVHERLSQQVMTTWGERVPDLFHVGAVPYQRGQSLGDVLSRADEALAQAASKGPNSWFAVKEDSTRVPLQGEQWRVMLTNALDGGQLTLKLFPVMTSDGKRVLHREGVVRLQIDAQGTLLPAGDFMPMATQLHLIGRIDLHMVRLAIEELRTNPGDIAINLASQTISDFRFRNELIELLSTNPEACKWLLFEVLEYGVFQQMDAFRDLARNLKTLGTRVGVEYFGHRFAESDQLADLGLDYIKVHPSYISDIGENPGNQEFLRGLCKVSHSIGITVVALGVESRADLPLLASLGFDGATGSGIR